MSSPAKARRAAQIWGGSSLAGNPCQRWLEMFTGLWREGGQPASPALPGSPLIWGAQGRHMTCPQGELMGTEEPGWKKLARMGTCHEYRHTVDEACCWPGALRGRSPRTREGRIGPTAQNSSGRWSVVREEANSDAELIARWLVLRCDLRHGEVRPHFGMHPVLIVQ